MEEKTHDIVVVSDLHIGRGRDRACGRHHRLEMFFFDEDFMSFCRWLCEESKLRERKIKLVLNGDTFDFLRIEHDGPMDPTTARQTVIAMMNGHKAFFDALRLMLIDGHSIVFVSGNHDMEVQWACVQREIVSRIVCEDVGWSESIEFRSWFYYEPGRVWIEHGSQYDPDNSVQYNLRSYTDEFPYDYYQSEIDSPLGTMFQRYIFNGLGNVTFIVPTDRARSSYFRWLIMNRPRLLWKSIRTYVPLLFKMMWRNPVQDKEHLGMLRQAHERELHDSVTDDIPFEELSTISDMSYPNVALRKALRGFARRSLVMIAVVFFAVIAIVGFWFAGFYAINQIEGGFVPKSALFVLMSIVMMFISLTSAAYLMIRGSDDDTPPRFRNAAQKISAVVDVPLVVFGHTHDEVVWRLNGGWYYNTGTWTTVFLGEELLPRERVQYTFLRITDDIGRLMYWSPGREQAIDVVLLEGDDPHDEPSKKDAPL